MRIYYLIPVCTLLAILCAWHAKSNPKPDPVFPAIIVKRSDGQVYTTEGNPELIIQKGNKLYYDSGGGVLHECITSEQINISKTEIVVNSFE